MLGNSEMEVCSLHWYQRAKKILPFATDFDMLVCTCIPVSVSFSEGVFLAGPLAPKHV